MRYLYSILLLILIIAPIAIAEETKEVPMPIAFVLDAFQDDLKPYGVDGQKIQAFNGLGV